jgi:PleD family two-component response regulator
MSGSADLGDKQVMIVGGKAHAQATLRTALAVAGIKNVEILSESRAAIELLRVERFDAVYIDERAQPYNGMPLYLAVRRAAGLVDPMVPIFMLCNNPRRRFVESLRDQGVTDVIARPTAAGTLMRKLRLALELPRAFIKVGDFFGPDRRSGQRAELYGGIDRRASHDPLAAVREPIDDRDDDNRDTVLI